MKLVELLVNFFSTRGRHTRCLSDWSSDVWSSDLLSLRICFCPHNPPRVVQGQRKARRNHVQTTTLLYFGRLGMGMGYRELSLEGVEIYDHPAHSRNMDSFPCLAREQSQSR